MKRAFTLIELLVVIAVIGVISSIVLAGISFARQKAINTKLAQDFRHIDTEIAIARQEINGNLGQVTGSYCTCSAGNLTLAWSKIGFSNPPRDPWGSIYMIDENEGESGGCLADTVWSYGPNKVWDGWAQTGDDIVHNVPKAYCP